MWTGGWLIFSFYRWFYEPFDTNLLLSLTGCITGLAAIHLNCMGLSTLSPVQIVVSLCLEIYFKIKWRLIIPRLSLFSCSINLVMFIWAHSWHCNCGLIVNLSYVNLTLWTLREKSILALFHKELRGCLVGKQVYPGLVIPPSRCDKSNTIISG